MSGFVSAVRHAGISVKNLDRSLFFYNTLLGLTICKQADEKGEFISELLEMPDVNVTTVKLSAENGPTLVELLHFRNPAPQEKQKRAIFDFGSSHIALTVKNIDVLYAILVKAGVPFRSPPLVSDDGLAKVAFCADPDGTPVELVEPLK
jgi:catechol 2,3-dioxygenase-like lactoylglutathione lyase family enzyme